MSLGDDATQIRRVLGFIAIELLQDGLSLLHELVLDLSRAQDVVGCDAGLPSIHTLAPQDSLGRYLNVGRPVYVHRAVMEDQAWDK